MRQSIKHRLVEALGFIERTSDKVARRLEPEAYRVWSMRPPEGADPLAETHITIKRQGDGTFIYTSGTIHREAPLLERGTGGHTFSRLMLPKTAKRPWLVNRARGAACVALVAPPSGDPVSASAPARRVRGVCPEHWT